MRTNITKSSVMRHSVVAVTGAALALSLAACAGSSDSSTAATTSPTAGVSASSQGIDAAHNAADIAFIKDMAPHHSGAIAMAKLADGQAGSAQVKDLAQRIAAAQGPEIDRMKAMATAWKVSLDTGAAAMTGMSGMGDDDTAALMPMSGSAFDKAFLTRMTGHHSSAVTMSKTELAKGQNAQAKAMATAIISAQEKEIAEMADLMTKN